MFHRHSPRRARLALTALERRLAPATFTVLNADDAGPGSLRQAILDANALAGADDINFDPAFFNAANPRTITLSAASGQLTISDDLTVNGPGAAILAVSGGNAVRVFNINDNAASIVAVNLSGMTITGGRTTSGAGGGIHVGNENLTLDRVAVHANAASNGGGVGNTGGGTLTVRDSTIAGNTATGSGGGICFDSGGSLLVENSTISGNIAVNVAGGGINFDGTVAAAGVTVRNSTIAENTAAFGGGLALRFLNTVNAPVLIQNSTVARNVVTTVSTVAGVGGGGIALVSAAPAATFAVVSSIVSGNRASAANGRDDIAAAAGTTVSINDSAIGDPDGFVPSPSSGNNLPFGATLFLLPLADNGGSTQTVGLGLGSAAVGAGSNPVSLTTDQRGTGYPRVIDATIDIGAFEGTFDVPAVAAGPFADLATASPAYTFTVTYAGATPVDVATLDGTDIRVTGPAGFSQLATFVSVSPAGNGSPRTATYSIAGPGNAFGGEDFGTYIIALQGGQVANTNGGTTPAAILGTFAVVIPQTFTVTNLNDAGAGSLRQAILDANATPGVRDTIVFQSGLSGTITLTQASGHMTITEPVAIVGPEASVLTVSGSGVARVFNLFNLSSVIDVSISGLTITGGAGIGGGDGSTVPGNGGAILNANEALTLDRVVLAGNSTSGGSGGGIWTMSGAGGSVTIRNSTVANNSVSGGGGGIGFFMGGSLLLENSTVSNNTAAFNGGGIDFRGNGYADSFTIRNSTIAGNRSTGSSASGGGVAIRGISGTALIQNSTVTLNSVASTSFGDGTGGGGIVFPNGSANSVLTLESTIVAGNTAPAFNGRSDLSVFTAATVNANFSAIGDPDGFTLSSSSGNNLPFGTPLGLSALADNGGPTQTVAFAPDSPLRNAGANPANLATDQRGPGFVRVEGPAADIGAFEFQVVAAPRVTGVAVNAGQANAAQRSRVTAITVTFSTPVTFAGAVADAFDLSRIDGGVVGGFTAVASVVNGVTVVTLSGFTGAETQFGSLADGRYRVVVRANQVTAGGQQLDGDGNGTGGDDYTLDGTTANGLFRLYGDADGNGVVNAFDFGQFRPAFGSSTGQAAYLGFLDLDGDGTINAFEFGQFRNRFGAGVP